MRSTLPRFGAIVPWAASVATDDVRRAPMLFRADVDFAYRVGGPVMRAFLDDLAFVRPGKYVSIDSRAHMLMPGMWPCIPGWHCDDFFRDESGQPNLAAHVDGRTWCEHVAMLLGDDVSLTQWETARREFWPPNRGTVYAALNAELERVNPPTRACAIGEPVRFDGLTIHRGMPATRVGWRLFIRATASDHHEPKNEVRAQTQVYLQDVGAGW